MKKLFLLVMLSLCAALPALCGGRSASLLTFYPGSEVYELEGHTALRVIDEQGDITYTWGTFDFNTPNFIYRFVKGETDYTVAAVPTDYYLDHYRSSGRRVMEQKLDLNDRQLDSLINLIHINLLPANRIYRYNYVLDNCATRALVTVEKATGDTLCIAPYAGSGTSFRDIMRHYHADYPWYQFGIDLALGSGLDRPITTREKAFAPVELFNMLQNATVNDGDGCYHPLVSECRELIPGAPEGATLPPTPWWLGPDFWCWVVFGLTTLVTWRDFVVRRQSRWIDSVLFGIFGIAGLLLTVLIFVSVHEATSPNWLYLWLNPACLFIAVGVWIKKWTNAVYWWQIVNFALVFTLGLLGCFGIQKLNTAFWPLIFSDLMRSLIYIYHNRCIAPRQQH